MIIDNGTQMRLTIGRLFDGLCGVQRGVLSFQSRLPIPSRIAGELDGEPVLLELRRSENNSGFYLATFQRLA